MLIKNEDIAKGGQGVLHVDVLAQQFAWEFTYPDLGVTTGDLRVPVDRQIVLSLRAKDVIHDFFVYETRIKGDAVPGIVNTQVRFTMKPRVRRARIPDHLRRAVRRGPRGDAGADDHDDGLRLHRLGSEGQNRPRRRDHAKTKTVARHGDSHTHDRHTIPHGAGGGHGHHGDYRSALPLVDQGVLGHRPSASSFGLLVPLFFRAVFGLEPLWNEQVYVTTTCIFSVLGFLIGIGCFDWWGRWMVGKHVDYEDHSFHGATSWRDYLRVNTDHKVIGIQYLVDRLQLHGDLGGPRGARPDELAQPGQQITNGEGYNTLFSGHAALMIFLVIIPSFAGLANYVLPIMIGAQGHGVPAG